MQDELFVDWVVHNKEEAVIFWEKWIRNNPDKRQTILTAAQLVADLNYKNQFSLTDSEYLDILEKSLSTSKQVFISKRDWNRKWLFRVASIIAIVFIAVAGIEAIKAKLMDPDQITEITRSTSLGQKAIVQLLDGSKVTLNSNSHLSFPSEFADDRRVVRLQGEAFFQVKTDNRKPFIVITGDLVTKVFGTSFNIKCDTTSNQVEVALLEGSVSVSDNHGFLQLMQPNDMVKYSPEKIEKQKFKNDEIVGWLEGKLIFNKATPEEVIKRLESWYGVSFELKAEPMFEGLYSGVFIDEPLKNVLEGLSITSKFEYSIRNRVVTIKNNKSNN